MQTCINLNQVCKGHRFVSFAGHDVSILIRYAVQLFIDIYLLLNYLLIL